MISPGGDKTTYEQAFRLLSQSTFGPTSHEILRVQEVGELAWIDEQLIHSSAYDVQGDVHCSYLERFKEIARQAEPAVYDSSEAFDLVPNNKTRDYQISAWFEQALHGPDQLRQRVAFALSQLLVVSSQSTKLNFRGDSTSYYYDILARHAFSNYRDLLTEVSTSVAMGIFLSHQGNKKYDPDKKTYPDENYARELMQLFTLGLWELNDDGSMKEDANGSPIPTYTQEDVEALARVMTGYDIKGNSRYGRQSRGNGEKWADAMEFTSDFHDYGAKTFLKQTIAEETPSQEPAKDLSKALDIIFAHPNVAPYVSRHLITQLVTSNPSAQYIERVSAVFNNNGSGVKGDLKATVRAILLDEEARQDNYKTTQHFGKAKEPLIAFTQFLRAFHVAPLNGWKSLGETEMQGVYQYRGPDTHLGQSPLRSPTVFNFFASDYIPPEPQFKDNSWISPELQIQSQTMLIRYSNLLLTLMNSNEKNSILLLKNDSLSEYAKTRNYKNINLLIYFDEELQVFEQSLDGDTSGDFVGLDDPTKKQQSYQTLLAHLEKKLFAAPLDSTYKDALESYALTINYADNKKEALQILKDTLRALLTSSQFMIQK